MSIHDAATPMYVHVSVCVCVICIASVYILYVYACTERGAGNGIAAKETNSVEKHLANIAIFRRSIADDKSSQVFCRSCRVMKTFWSCHLIINKNLMMIVGMFVTY